MACLGVHFALSDEEVATLRAQPDDDARLDLIKNVIEEQYLQDPVVYAAESAKAWDAMDRALAVMKVDPLDPVGALRCFVVEGESMYSAEDYILSLKTPDQVKAAAEAAARIDEAELRHRYFMIDVAVYREPLSEDDFQHTWEGFSEVRSLFQTAAREGRYVLFTVDQ